MMRKGLLTLLALLMVSIYCSGATISKEAVSNKPEKPKGQVITFENLGFRVTMPEKNWKAAKSDDDAIPLELTYRDSSLIQVMTFLKTMTTIPELTVSLNKTYETRFSEDGASHYAIFKENPWKYGAWAGRRVMARWKKDKEEFISDQIYIDGTERIVVFVLTSGNSGYAALKGDFEKFCQSFEAAGTE
jgi:hypothetical protein